MTKTCIICAASYTPTAHNQQRCPDCAKNRRMRCSVCGNIYTGSNYNRIGNRSTCPACLAAGRAERRRGTATPQSDAARKKAFQAKGTAGRENIKKAISALATSPHSAKNSHEHMHAKIWFLRSPDGTRYETQNLNAFIDEHPDDFPNVKMAKKQLQLIGRSLREPDGQFRHQYSYHGWTMFAPPALPDAVIASKAHREALEAERQKRREENHPGFINPDE